LDQIEPCGQGNSQPVLLSRGVEVRDRQAVGGEQKHLKLLLRDEQGVAWDAIFFRRGDCLRQVPARIDVAYALEVNEWNDNKRLQLHVQDLRTAAK
ncbi:MAG: single-stranded-DNA-specific exonuclease RecJ, partial [Anaerolineae bacterium]